MSEAETSNIHGDRPAAASKKGMADHKELSAFAFQRTRMPIVICDAREPDYPIVLANDAFLDLIPASVKSDSLGLPKRLRIGIDVGNWEVYDGFST